MDFAMVAGGAGGRIHRAGGGARPGGAGTLPRGPRHCVLRARAGAAEQSLDRNRPAGERFRDPKHVYADDLDLFGRGSLFELLSTARTGAGEAALASWLLAPGDREALTGRQQAVEELRGRVDLREELALMGEDIRAAVDADAPARWGVDPPAGFFASARVAAFGLAAAAVITLGLWIAHVAPLSVFLVVLLAEIGFSLAIRAPLERVIEGVATPGNDLTLLVHLLERVEREQFRAPALVALKSALEMEGRTASQRIKRLARLIEHFDSARFHDLFRLASRPLLWIPQFGMAIEAWRRESGPRNRSLDRGDRRI